VASDTDGSRRRSRQPLIPTSEDPYALCDMTYDLTPLLYHVMLLSHHCVLLCAVALRGLLFDILRASKPPRRKSGRARAADPSPVRHSLGGGGSAVRLPVLQKPFPGLAGDGFQHGGFPRQETGFAAAKRKKTQENARKRKLRFLRNAPHQGDSNSVRPGQNGNFSGQDAGNGGFGLSRNGPSRIKPAVFCGILRHFAVEK